MISSLRVTSVATNAIKLLSTRAMSANAMEDSSYQFKTLAVSAPKDNVLHVELNRPDKLNAMNIEMWKEMTSLFNTAGSDPDVRAIVLSGRGKVFTAGLDLIATAPFLSPDSKLDASRNAFKLLDFIKFAQESITVVERCRKPVVIAIHQACIGGGVDLSTACDIRLCTEDSYFCVKEVDIGLAADIGTLQRLPKVIGNDSIARELCLTARKLPADEAKEIGLVSRVYKDKETMMEQAIELAGLIATKSPVAVQGTKIHMNFSRDHTTQESLDYMATWNAAMLQTEDILKSAEAFMTKKTPADVTYAKL